MSYSPHQQRVIDEKKELDVKIYNLNNFVNLNPIYQTLPQEEQDRLSTQLDIMTKYSNILNERITAFSTLL